MKIFMFYLWVSKKFWYDKLKSTIDQLTKLKTYDFSNNVLQLTRSHLKDPRQSVQINGFTFPFSICLLTICLFVSMFRENTPGLRGFQIMPNGKSKKVPQDMA